VCANGHFTTPNLPEFEGFTDFCGRILHSHDFRNGSDFKNLDVLIVGTSYSGEDIASHCYKAGSKTVTISYRNRPSLFDWPENFSQVPQLVRADKDNFVYFKDGSKKKVDAIILCTGYLSHYPFLEDNLRLVTVNRMWPPKLYKGILWEDNPKLIYLGSADQFYTYNMFDI
jgi:trimethylamine monooxygenase